MRTFIFQPKYYVINNDEFCFQNNGAAKSNLMLTLSLKPVIVAKKLSEVIIGF